MWNVVLNDYIMHADGFYSWNSRPLIEMLLGSLKSRYITYDSWNLFGEICTKKIEL